MPAYDDQLFSPPAPVARVMLHNPANGMSMSEVLMLIDPGADSSLLPQPAIEQLGIPTHLGQQFELEAFDGSKSAALLVIAELVFLRKTFKGEFLLVNQPTQIYGILGRDVLNKVRLLLNGPQLNWEEVRLK